MEIQNAMSKEEILEEIRKYCLLISQPKNTKKSRINYAGRIYNEEEIINLVDSALEFLLTCGHYTEEFEEKLAQYLHVEYCSFVNSGSSANLLAFMALTSPELGDRAIQRGDEVITVAAGFPTTVSPIIQYGAIPVFVDIEIPFYNIDVQQLETALSPKTKAVMIAHTLGNPFDLAAVKAFCDRHGLWLVEDNCDALGAEFLIDGKYQKTGTVGDIGTSSFYPAHHITTGEGGAVYTNNELLNQIVRSLRDWGRACVCPSGRDGVCGHRFDRKFGELPCGYDHKYVYSRFGYNLKATDMQAAIGVAQLKKLPQFVEKRNSNYKLLQVGLLPLQDVLLLPENYSVARPCWFGFPITCKKQGDRDKLVHSLEKSGIQTRMLFAGNLLRHPCFDEMRRTGNGFRTPVSLIQTDRVVEDTFWIGVYPGLSEEDLQYIIDAFFRFSNQVT